jgi:hypothetical protein
VLRRLSIVLLAGVFAAPAHAAATTLMPGVTYTRQVAFTPHGPVQTNVLVAPRPGGLWGLHPVLSDGAISGRASVTAMESVQSAHATVAGVNGDYFDARDGHPAGVLMQGGGLDSLPDAGRTSIGIGVSGNLDLRRVAAYGFWQGRGRRRPLRRLNQPPGRDGIALYTPTWGSVTPTSTDALEAVLYPFPRVVPDRDLIGVVLQFTRGGGTPIPRGGAVLSARGESAQSLSIDAPPGASILIRMTLKPDWSGIVDAVGGGPALVRNGRAVFRANEDFLSLDLAPRKARTAIGQRRDGSIVMVAVDGDRPGYSVGMTNFELAQTMARLGCVTASGLDTGDSTTMAFEGRLLNRPSDPAGQRLVAEALLVFYYGVYAAPPSSDVLSPNGDGVGDRETLTYKVVRPSVVTAKVIGADGAARFAQTIARTPGTYAYTWLGTKPGGSVDTEGLWHWSVSAVDDLGRRSADDRPFWLNNTLGNLRVPPKAYVDGRRKIALASFTVTHAATVTTTVETQRGVVVRRLSRRKLSPGTFSLTWNGRDSHRRLVVSRRYVVRVSARNQYGPVSLAANVTVRRR